MERDPHSGLRFEPRGEESGGVTGALLEMRTDGRFIGMEAIFRRNGSKYADGSASLREGLGKDEDVGLAWYDGTGLG